MGASSSKAAAAQKAASRAAAAARPAADSATAAAAAASSASRPAVPASIVTAERERQAALLSRQQDSTSLPAEQRSQNEGLEKSMNQVMAGMKQYQYEVYRSPEVDKLYSLKKKTKEEKAAELVGRLPSPSLKSLLEEHARAAHAGRPLDVADLARRYGANPDVLRQFLQYNAGPVVQTGRDGRPFASWPDEKMQEAGSGVAAS